MTDSLTVGALVRREAKRLESLGEDNALQQVRWLLEKVTGKTQSLIFAQYDTAAPTQVCEQLAALVTERLEGEPLQYLLGEWEFMGNSFLVGEGVLIPRPETELLVQAVLDRVPQDSECVIFDLCAGTGCIGISLAKQLRAARVFCVELYDKPLEYLTKNIGLSGAQNVSPVRGDVLRGFESLALPVPDIIVSNPPYIESDEISSLDKVVLHEPRQALDGGKNGLLFYEAIARLWFPFIKQGGFFAAEFGDTQAQKVCELFWEHEHETLFDLSGLERAAIIERGKK